MANEILALLRHALRDCAMTQPAPSDKLRPMSIMLRTELYDQLRVWAFRERTSMSRVIAYALAEYFDKETPA